MTTVLAIGCLLVLNVGLLWVLVAAPLGNRKITVRRVFGCEVEDLWQAVDPAGAAAAWNSRMVSSERVAGLPGVVEQVYDRPDRKGQPMRRRIEVLYDEPAAGSHRGVASRVIDDSALDAAFWRHFAEYRSLDRVDGGCRLTIAQSDCYRGVAFILFRWIMMRRELAALDNWLRTGNGSVSGLLEHPLTQAALAIVSVLVLWPFFGLSLMGLYLSVALTVTTVLHELGHMAAYRACGHRTAKMFIIPLLGGVAVGGRPYDSLFEVAFCALMGAGMSGFVVSIAMSSYPLAGSGSAAKMLLLFLLIAGSFNLLNLAPVARFDGAQVLRQILNGPRQVAIGSFLSVMPLLFVGWYVGVPGWALVIALTVLAVMSLFLKGRSARPRAALDGMNLGQRMLMGSGFAAAVFLHGAAVIFAAGNLGL